MTDLRHMVRYFNPRSRRGAAHRVVLIVIGLLLAAGIGILALGPSPSGRPADPGAGQSSAGDPATPADADAAEPPVTPAVAVPLAPERRAELMAAADPVSIALGQLGPIDAIRPATPPALATDLSTIFRLIEDRRTGPARVRLRRLIDAADTGTLPREDVGHAAFLFGMTYHREKLYTEATPWLARAMAEMPGYPPTYYFAGWGAYYLGRLDQAADLFARHLAWQPEAADSHFGLGLVDLEQGDPEAAIVRFDRSLELQPDDPDTDAARRSRAKSHARRGDALAELDRLDEARDALTAAITLWPDHHEAWARLARVERRRGNPDAAAAAEASQRAALERIGGPGGANDANRENGAP